VNLFIKGFEILLRKGAKNYEVAQAILSRTICFIVPLTIELAAVFRDNGFSCTDSGLIKEMNGYTRLLSSPN
jgi:hypothetical protein